MPIFKQGHLHHHFGEEGLVALYLAFFRLRLVTLIWLALLISSVGDSLIVNVFLERIVEENVMKVVPLPLKKSMLVKSACILGFLLATVCSCENRNHVFLCETKI
ncbi:hypothetical protein ACJX0J_017730 [Zea mays]